jgi:hypothetical protein
LFQGRRYLSSAVYETGRAIVHAAPNRWADVALAPDDLSQLKGFVDTLQSGAAAISIALTDGHPLPASDNPTTSITAWYDGKPLTVTTKVGHLQPDVLARTVDRTRLEAFDQLDKLLQSHASSAPNYSPDGIAVIATKVDNNPLSSIPTLPWPSAPLEQLGEPFLTANARCGVVTGPDVLAVMTAISAPQAHSWSSGGGEYVVEAQPLLPGQSTCQDALG